MNNTCEKDQCSGQMQKCAECPKTHCLKCGDGHDECMYCKLGDNPQIHCREHLTKLICPHYEFFTVHIQCREGDKVCVDHLDTDTTGGYVSLSFISKLKDAYLKEFYDMCDIKDYLDVLRLRLKIENLERQLQDQRLEQLPSHAQAQAQPQAELPERKKRKLGYPTIAC